MAKLGAALVGLFLVVLRIILIAAQKNYVLEAPLGARPAADATDDIKNI